MMRKFLFFAFSLLTLTYAGAQAVGEWKIWPRYMGDISDIVETPQKVYFTSGNRLFSYDKEANESYNYTTDNKLNDVNISFIKYNNDNKYLFIAYDNGNIDLLYDNGKVVSMSDIKDAIFSYKKGINNVVFANNRIYVATQFGIVVIDDQRHEVTESGIFGSNVQGVAPVGDFLFIVADGLKYAPLKGYHNTLDKFTLLFGMNAEWLDVIGNNSIVFKNKANGNKLSRHDLDVSGDKPGILDTENFNFVPTSRFMKASHANYVQTADKLVFFNEEGKTSSELALPETLRLQSLATQKEGNNVWAADFDGVANYIVDGSGITVVSDKYRPEGIVTDQAFFLKFDNEGGLWVGNLGATMYKPTTLGAGDKAESAQALTRIKNGKIEDMNVYDAEVRNTYSINSQTDPLRKRLYGGSTGFAIDPENPNRYYQGVNLEGVYVIEDNKQLYAYYEVRKRDDLSNAPFTGYYASNRVEAVEFDPEGNLWVGSWAEDLDKVAYWVLPKTTLRSKKLEDITKTDWKVSKHLGVDGGQLDMVMLFCKHSPTLISFHCGWGKPLTIYHSKGSWSNLEDAECFQLLNLKDQDGIAWNPNYTICAAEDHNGRVWVGGETVGIIEIENPGKLTPSSTVRRIKVPRNDGTNYADYLCENDRVYGIAVDNSNRKWIATQASGVYLVSENGDKILEHFTTENSPLPSNEIVSVACDPNSNTVYFGLTSGLVSYNSTSSPAADDYSEIYAYPNPVRPDYTGYITITGLMDNSVVKITDSAGNLVYQTRSEGGMAIWDGCDAGHNRVKTGVYFVMASQDGNGSSKGAVTKIMVVR